MKKNLSPRAIAKLRAVRDAILAQPEFYNQNAFCDTSSKNVCNTACCIGGWLVWNDSPLAFKKAVQQDIKAKDSLYTNYFDWSIASTKALGLPAGFSTELFNRGGAWARPYNDLWMKASTPQERAAIGAAVIEHFIATDAGF